MAVPNVALRFGIYKFDSMRHEFETRSDVTYIGPRSFVAGLAVLCALFAGIAYGAARFADMGESDASLAVAVPQPEVTIVAHPARGAPSTPVPVAAITGVAPPTPRVTNRAPSPSSVPSASSVPNGAVKISAGQIDAPKTEPPNAAATRSPVPPDATPVARKANATPDAPPRPIAHVVRIAQPRSTRSEPSKIDSGKKPALDDRRDPDVQPAAVSDARGISKRVARAVTFVGRVHGVPMPVVAAAPRPAGHRSNELLVPFASTSSLARPGVLDPRAKRDSLLVIKAVPWTPTPDALKPSRP